MKGTHSLLRVIPYICCKNLARSCSTYCSLRMNLSSDEDDDLEPVAFSKFSCGNAVRFCQRLPGACLQFGDTDSTLPLKLVQQIRLSRAHLPREKFFLRGTQTTSNHRFAFSKYRIYKGYKYISYCTTIWRVPTVCIMR